MPDSEVNSRLRSIGDIGVAGLPVRPFPLMPGQRHPGIQIVIDPDVVAQIHAYGDAHLQEEVCGVLVGGLYQDESGPFLHIDASIQGEHADRKLAGVTFTHDTWSHINRMMDTAYSGRQIVGWYHTHPGFGIFLSAYDLFIHESVFGVPWQIAYVYDPCQRQDGVFAWQQGKPQLIDCHCADQIITPPRPAAAKIELEPEPMAADSSEAVASTLGDVHGPPIVHLHRRIPNWTILVVLAAALCVGGLLRELGDRRNSGSVEKRQSPSPPATTQFTQPGDSESPESGKGPRRER